MSTKPKPTDTAYLIGYNTYSNRERALVIAPNPIRAKEVAREKLPPGANEEVKVLGELRDRVKTAEQSGLAFL